MLHRREAIQIGVGTAASAVSVATDVRSLCAQEETSPRGFVDTNCHLFRWPFRRLPLDDTTRLVEKLRSLGFTQAWAGSFEGLLHRDLGSVNERLVQRCSRFPELIPIGCVNPMLPDWEGDLQRCLSGDAMRSRDTMRSRDAMPGVRLYPSYHGYSLGHPSIPDILRRASDAGRFVQLVVSMEDKRTQHPSMRVNDLDLTPLADLMASISTARVQLLNWRPTEAMVNRLAKVDGVCFDTARVEGTDGIPNLVQQLPEDRVMLGTHAPFLIPEAALIRVHESGRLDEAAMGAVLSRNARKFAGTLR